MNESSAELFDMTMSSVVNSLTIHENRDDALVAPPGCYVISCRLLKNDDSHVTYPRVHGYLDQEIIIKLFEFSDNIFFSN